MYGLTLPFLAAFAACTLVASADYNSTFTNEWYLRAGYVPLVYQPGADEFQNVRYAGFDKILFANYYGESPVSQPIYDGCDGLCAVSFPFGIQFNTTQPSGTVNLTSYGYAPDALSLYSLNYACIAIGPNGTDHKGHKTYGRVPRDCTISLTGKTSKGKTLKHSFNYKAQGIPSNLTYGALPSGWKNLTAVYLNATSKPSKSFPYPVVVAFDDITYGIREE